MTPTVAQGDVTPDGAARSADAILAAALFAIDPVGSGGLLLVARHSPAREAYLAWLLALMPERGPVHRIAPHIPEDRLMGGIDVARSLVEGRPVRDPGLLAMADGGLLVLSNAERAEARLAGHLAAALDRNGPDSSGIAFIALDERIEDDEGTPSSLTDRLGMHVLFDAGGHFASLPAEALATVEFTQSDAIRARALLPATTVSDAALEALTSAAIAFGIRSIRAPLQALAIARAHAALDERSAIDEQDIAVAVRLALLPRATQIPAPPDQDAPPDKPEQNDTQPPNPDEVRALEDIVLDAARSALDGAALDLIARNALRARQSTRGRSGQSQKSRRRGRPKGSIAGDLRPGTRLDLLATLRAAVPWQPLRRKVQPEGTTAARILVRRGDFRIRRYEEPQRRTTVFVVDASGSAAVHRLAETKGAVETLLAESYVRRDQVALIAFRQKAAETLLPPTRALARAKRALAGLPGGGPTPLAAGLAAAEELLINLKRRGEEALAVVMTDGRGNVARDGTQGRAAGDRDAFAMAEHFRRHGLDAIVIDTSARPDASAKRLADAMGAAYLPLPYADARAISRAVTAAHGA
ncbi:MAG: hypothetical protein RL291_1252 [Pseudomonadota bacterium]